MNEKKNRGFRAIAIVALVIAVAGISVAFAALSQQLTINATGKVEGSTWDIHWSAATGTATGGTGASAGIVTPSGAGLTTGAVALTITGINLKTPGDKVEWALTAKNNGSLDAKLANIDTILQKTIDIKSADSATFNENLLDIKITKADGSAITNTDTLASGATQDYKLTIEFKTEATVVPSQDVDITVISNFPWVQN